MNDEYDLFCTMKLRDRSTTAPAPQNEEDVACACARYLKGEGYTTLSHDVNGA